MDIRHRLADMIFYGRGDVDHKTIVDIVQQALSRWYKREIPTADAVSAIFEKPDIVIAALVNELLDYKAENWDLHTQIQDYAKAVEEYDTEV